MQGCSTSLTTPLKSPTAVDSCSQYKTTAELTLFSRYVHKNKINKIIHIVSVIIFFPLQDDISKPLDLGFFACSEVNVSFAVVNAYGTSNYSASTQVCVHGGRV